MSVRQFQTLWKESEKMFYKFFGMPHFCGMDKHLTPAEAWADFLQHMEQRKNKGEISRIPKDVQEGKYAAEGLRRHGLGEKRIKKLLEKYARDRYEFRGVFILHEK